MNTSDENRILRDLLKKSEEARAALQEQLKELWTFNGYDSIPKVKIIGKDGRVNSVLTATPQTLERLLIELGCEDVLVK